MIKKKNKVERSGQGNVTLDQDLWQQFVHVVYAHIDPVLASMLKATDLLHFDKARNVVEVATLKKFVLFQDLFLQHKPTYQEYLNRIFGYQVVLVVHFTKVEEVVRKEPAMTVSVQSEQKQEMPKTVPVKIHRPEAAPAQHSWPARARKPYTAGKPQAFSRNEKNLDVSDKNTWKITHILLEHLGGTVREIIKESDEFNA